MMKTARQRLLEYLEQRQRATASELSQALKMTSANARHHLAILRSEGVVDIVGIRDPQGRGRPALLYGIRRVEQAHNLEILSSALLEQLLQGLSGEQAELVLRRLATRMASRLEAQDQSEKRRNPAQRLSKLVQQLNRMHYQARWEAHATSPHMLLNHCPYAELIEDHPELCRFDAYLLETASGLSAHQIARLEPTSQGGIQCVFALRRT